MIKKTYKLICDNCGKVMAVTNKIPNTVAQYKEIGIYCRGRAGIFCNKECYEDFKLHGKKY